MCSFRRFSFSVFVFVAVLKCTGLIATGLLAQFISIG
jgi:hypothetical protein